MEEIQVYKIVLIGNSGTGKTNITTRYIKGQYVQSLATSVGAEFHTQTVPIKGKNIKITIWDTAGQERYKSLSNVYYKGARGVIIVYDVADPQSYVDIQNWMRLANLTVELNKVTVFVVGNKLDLKPIVPFQRVLKEYKQAFDVECWEVSAKTGQNINQMFQAMFERIYKQGNEIKNSLFYGQSELVTYSQIERESLLHIYKGRNSKEMKPIQQAIIEEKEDASRTRNEPESVAVTKSRMMTLSVNDEKERMQQNKKKKKKCCW